MITIRDIHKRLKLLPESADVGKNYFSYLERAETAINSGNPTKIMKMIESGINDTTNSILLDTMLNLYDALYLNGGNAANIRHYGHLIAEDYVARTRDAKEAQTYLKRKLGRIKSSISTKVGNDVQSVQDAIKSAIEGVKDRLPTNAGTATLTPSNNDQQNNDKPSEEKNEAFIMSYQNMLDEATKMIYCDRILDNYNRISKRFNIDRIIQENIYDNSIDDTIGYICRLIETYDVPDKVKYNTALETVWYGFAKNYVDCSPSQYTTLITDYFLAKGNNRKMCSKLLEASMIVKKDDYQGDLEIITEEEPEEENYPQLSYDSLNAESAHIQDQIRHQLLGVNEIHAIRLNEEVDFNKIFRDFRSSDEEHKETKLQVLIRKLFSKNPNDIVNGIPTVLNYIRIVFVLGAFALNPVIGAVSAIADIFLALKTNREQTKKMLEAVQKEIDISKKKLNSSSNPDEKKRLERYIKELENGYNKIDEYYETKLTDEEVDKKYEEKYADDNDSGDFDFGDFDDSEFDINEACIVSIGNLAERYDKLPVKKFSKSDIETIIDTAKLYNEMADVSINLPNILDPTLLESVLDDRIAVEKGKAHYEGTSYNQTKYLLTEAKSKITNSKINAYDGKTFYDDLVRLEATVNILEALNDIKTSCDYYHPLIEGSFTNSIKLASEKVKKTLQKLSDKERTISKNIDVAANNTKKAMEKSLTSDNREAVIKGSVLPSASKTIKLAITTAGLALINPALAVIGALGYMAVSKKYKAKERQMIIDEIEIEMKMCEKYIELAESKNDMVALKKLLTIQRELERQRQRIKYNMKVKFGQKYFDSNNAPAYTIDDD